MNHEIEVKLDKLWKITDQLDNILFDLIEDGKIEDAIKLAEKMDARTGGRFDFISTCDY